MSTILIKTMARYKRFAVDGVEVDMHTFKGGIVVRPSVVRAVFPGMRQRQLHVEGKFIPFRTPPHQWQNLAYNMGNTPLKINGLTFTHTMIMSWVGEIDLYERSRQSYTTLITSTIDNVKMFYVSPNNFRGRWFPVII